MIGITLRGRVRNEEIRLTNPSRYYRLNERWMKRLFKWTPHTGRQAKPRKTFNTELTTLQELRLIGWQLHIVETTGNIYRRPMFNNGQAKAEDDYLTFMK